jgi:hypothetical protein
VHAQGEEQGRVDEGGVLHERHVAPLVIHEAATRTGPLADDPHALVRQRHPVGLRQPVLPAEHLVLEELPDRAPLLLHGGGVQEAGEVSRRWPVPLGHVNLRQQAFGIRGATLAAAR